MSDFQNPYLLLMIIPLFIYMGFYFFYKINTRTVAVPLSSRQLVRPGSGIVSRFYNLLPLFRFASITLLILSLARPGTRVEYADVTSQGIDIMIVQDISESMLSIDFNPNRLAVAKEVVKNFVLKRVSDRIGMIIFTGKAYLQCPLTNDKEIISELINEIEFDSIDANEGGTAIGEALGLAAARLADSTAASRVVLLITDGANNRGTILPETAAEVCAKLGIRVYVVGIGSEGEVPMVIPRGPRRGVSSGQINFDEKVMKTISDTTAGKYYRAKSSEVFMGTMDEIDKLEKSEYKIRTYSEFSDNFFPFVICAALLFMIEFILRAFVFRKIP